MIIIAVILKTISMSLILGACSLESEGLRSIRGHTEDLQGIAHAVPMVKGERYCRLCHGENLVGGTGNQPSCYQCHGRTWNEIDGAASRAPADHTVNNDGYLHHPSLTTPTTVCVSCHGDQLQGNGTSDTPSCFLCHDQRW